MRASILVVIVVIMHICAVGGIIFIQGCGTTRTAEIEAPPAPVMPPQKDASTSKPARQPMFKPPRPAAPAPAAPSVREPQTYVIQKGDTLSGIAKRLNVSYRELAEINGIDNPDRIRIGQKLTLPPYADAPPSQSSAPPPKKRIERQPVRRAAEGAEYVVEAGDALSKIAAQYGVTVRALKEANGLTGDIILVGQTLIIPGVERIEQPSPAPQPKPQPTPAPREPRPEPEPVVETPVPEPQPVVETPAPMPEPAPEPALTGEYTEKPFSYTVAQGETIEDVAKMFVVSTNDLMEINNITDPSAIEPGQSILIPSKY